MFLINIFSQILSKKCFLEVSATVLLRLPEILLGFPKDLPRNIFVTFAKNNFADLSLEFSNVYLLNFMKIWCAVQHSASLYCNILAAILEI